MTAYTLPIPPLAATGHASPALTGGERLVSRLTILYLATFVCEGALRFILNKAHLSSMLYLRDLLPVMGAGVLLTTWMGNRRQPMVPLLVVMLLLFHFFIGFFFIGNLFQQLFGMKMLMPVVLGLAVGHMGLPMTLERIRWYAAFTIIIVVASLAINYKVPFPWEGADFESVFGVTPQGRNWTAGSFRRLAGLSRSSYDAACALLYCAAIVVASFRGVFFRISMWLLAFIGIALTTSKGSEVAMLALAGVVIFADGGRRIGWLRFCVLGSLFLVLLAPMLALVMDVRIRDFVGSAAWWLSSYADRMENTWPRALKLLMEHGNIVIGRGIGGVGTPQGFGEARLYSPADNIFVYWTLTMGMLGWAYGGAILTKLLTWHGETEQQRLVMYGFVISVLIYGIGANIMEQPLSGFGVGYVIAVLFRPRTLNGKPHVL
ncbi:hypothetical protein SAMN05216319_3621 [Duganella sp. CF402]|uniref:hypothetical protein n=1 Tax=unclassified Duganella TaxID=2636909 RepID=UPI0008B9E60C|nr:MULTISPECIES: hypothetical protein [unclassified Duganella]RZT04592.1 hypothetical protein EV582_5484 [Duganella sp. BK701]SEM30972.1 hypothetical protein SAMN05216319_3621 [Duganella sp. CF402]